MILSTLMNVKDTLTTSLRSNSLIEFCKTQIMGNFEVAFIEIAGEQLTFSKYCCKLVNNVYYFSYLIIHFILTCYFVIN